MLEHPPGLFVNWYWIGVQRYSLSLVMEDDNQLIVSTHHDGHQQRSMPSIFDLSAASAADSKATSPEDLLHSWNSIHSAIRSLDPKLAKRLLREWQELKIEDVNLGGLSLDILRVCLVTSPAIKFKLRRGRRRRGYSISRADELLRGFNVLGLAEGIISLILHGPGKWRALARKRKKK